jgi:hypothetical protein
VFHTATLGHFPVEARERFRSLVPELSRQHDLFWLSSEGSANPQHRGQFETMLTTFHNGRRSEYRLAYNHTHGAWVEWLADERPAEPML